MLEYLTLHDGCSMLLFVSRSTYKLPVFFLTYEVLLTS